MSPRILDGLPRKRMYIIQNVMTGALMVCMGTIEKTKLNMQNHGIKHILKQKRGMTGHIMSETGQKSLKGHVKDMP